MTQYIVSSGTTTSITVGSGSTMSVLDTGIAQDIIVTSGGVISAYDGGVTSGVQISRNPSSRNELAVEYINSGGTSYKSVVHGSLEVVAGGKAYGTTIYGSEAFHGNMNVYNGGIAVSTTVNLDGVVSVTSGTVSATVLNQGLLLVSSGGVAFNTIVNVDGGDNISAGGKASGTQLFGGGETVFSGGQAYGTTAKGGAQVVDGGKAYNTIVSSGGDQTVQVGTAFGTTINVGGFEYVYGGTESGTKIAGGTLVLDGGKSEGAIKFSGSGGELIISSTQMPTDTISGFTSGDEIQLADVTYATSDSDSVNAPGVVTVSAGGSEYNLHIVGATVGETDFVFGSGSILTKTATPEMTFLRPPVSPSAGLGGAWNGPAPAFTLTAADFAPKLLGGTETVPSSSHFGGLHSQETPPPILFPVSITQPF